tara:strand:- start:477 stop:1256 length:780 start_codon:yes stop_codon:yes gene_type:complete
MFKLIDKYLINFFSIDYLALTRDQFSHDRFIFGLNYIKKLKNSQKKFDILDVGCGSCNFYEYLNSSNLNFSYTGMDYDNKKLKKNIKFNTKKNELKIEELNLKYANSNKKYDIVWCSEVIEHIIDHDNFFKFLVNSCKNGGHIILTSPNIDFINNYGNKFQILLKKSEIEDGGHVRLGYVLEDFNKFAKNNSLKILDNFFISECDERRIRGRYYYKNEFLFLIFNFLCAIKIFKYKKYIYEDNNENKSGYHCIASTYLK